MNKPLYTVLLNDWAKIYFNDSFFDTIVSEVIKEERISYPFEIEFSLIHDQEMREINNTYRSKNVSTDVLTFRDEESAVSFPHVGTLKHLGEILVSYETAQRQAEQKKHSIRYEGAYLFVHGFLHLLDYDHERSTEEEKVMFEKADRIMNNIRTIL